ncbi:MAG: hypothetical protein PVH00_12850 [Gemmatimonadota bacterium]
MKSSLHGTGRPASSTRIAGLADEVPLDKKFLLYFSIVNMEKGIGRGW